MLKWLFRLAVILILLLGLSKYTSIFDNTKIKPYLNRVERSIQEIFGNTDNQASTGGALEDDIIESTSVTGSEQFDINDIMESEDNSDASAVQTSGSPIASPEHTKTLPAIEEINEPTNTGNTISAEEFRNKYGSLRIANCISPWGKFVPANTSIIAFESSSSHDCKWEKRVCSNGKLNGSFQYDTCYYSDALAKQAQQSLLTNAEIDALKQDYGSFGTTPSVQISQNSATQIAKKVYNDDEMIIGKEAGPGIVINSKSENRDTNNNQNTSLSNNVNRSQNDPEKHFLGKPISSIDILANGQTELNNNVLKNRSLKKQLTDGGELFDSNNRILDARSSYERKFCITPRGSPLSNGQLVFAYKYSQAINGSCELETRYCIDGKLQGNFVNQTCEGPYPQIIATLQTNNATAHAIQVGYSQTNSIASSIGGSLDLMSAPGQGVNYPSNTNTSTANTDYNISSASEVSQNSAAVIYHQPDELNFGDQAPEYQFLHGVAPYDGCNDSMFGYVPQGNSVIAYNSTCQAQFRMCNLGRLAGGAKFEKCE